MTLSITPIPAFKDNYIWVVVNRIHGSALVVDPGDAGPVIDYLQQHQLALSAVLITHHHSDHTNGLSDLLKHYSAPVFGSQRCKIPLITERLSEHQAIHLDAFPIFHTIDIPGHTLDHIAYYSPGLLFCGDTLFSAGCGRLFEGTARQMYASLQKITALPDETQIYCAHEYTLNNLLFAQHVEPGNPKIQERIHQVRALRKKNKPSIPSFLNEEKLINPFLRCSSLEIIQHAEDHAGQTLTNPIDVFHELRTWKNSF